MALFDLVRNTALAYGCPKMHVAERSYGSQLQHVGLKYGGRQQWGALTDLARVVHAGLRA